MNITTEINPDWWEYDEVIGRCQLIEYGVIFLDKYGCPIDNEYEVAELYKKYKENL